MPPKIKSRKPTGVVPFPLVLIEGEEGAGKTYAAAQFSASEQIGQMYWIDLAEGSADEYAAIPGARYLIIEHDGTYRDIREQVEAVYFEAREAARAGKPPVVLTIDSVSALWRMLTTWTQERARRTKKNSKVLAQDPDAAVDIAMNLWNDAVDRWSDVMHYLRTFPGIVLVLARGKEVSSVDENGNPITGRREWKVVGHKDLGFDCSVWVRMRRGQEPEVVKVRSLRMAVPDRRPLQIPDFTIEDLVFNRMGCSVDSQPRVMPELAADRTKPWLARIEAATDKATLKQLWDSAHPQQSGLSEQEGDIVAMAIRRRVAKLAEPKRGMEDEPQSDADKLREAAEKLEDDAKKLRAAVAAKQDADAEFAGDEPPADS
ncbi:AAA family ATPase [Kitasatospora sp. MBT63]|uniref:AAA family ATPase n=1 Tax=Kitasatospora sp. MBT63 TaxID=1444768 RepID=UPI00068FCBEC|nr:AAA family ATPase [Kitasatospora sp. MBT63]